MSKTKCLAMILAGGQGTRLGVDKSKGLVDSGIPKPLYIFECLINNMLRVVKQVGSYIHLYVMTSTINDEAIRVFLKEKNYFGYDENYITFFVQDMCPAISTDKKLFLSSKYELALSPNGNGGWFLSLQNAGLIDQMKAAGVEWLNVFAVDNVLQKIADPVFFGAVLERGCDSGTKVIRKANPEEKVGVMCLRGGRPSVVEYTELSEQMRYEKNEAGEYCYNFGVTLNYLFRIDKLESLTGNSALHIAHKKIKHLNDEGIVVEPDEPNGYKFETFIIDMVEYMNDCLVYEVVREKEFAPIKNKVGVDSVDTARALLEKNGVTL